MQSTRSVLSECERLAGRRVEIRSLGGRMMALVEFGSSVTAAHGSTAEEALSELRDLLSVGLQVAVTPREPVAEIGMWY